MVSGVFDPIQSLDYAAPQQFELSVVKLILRLQCSGNHMISLLEQPGTLRRTIDLPPNTNKHKTSISYENYNLRI